MIDSDAIKQQADVVNIIGHYVALRRQGSSHTGLCPFHDDKNPSFTVTPGKGFHCFGCGAKGDVFAFIMLREGVAFTEAVRRVADMCGASVDMQQNGKGHHAARRAVKPRVVATYEYRAASGELLYTVERVEPGRNGKKKDFFQHRLNPADGRRINGITAGFYRLTGNRWNQIKDERRATDVEFPEVERVLFRLPELLASDCRQTVLVAEGEKDALSCVRLGWVATSKSGGACEKPEQWLPSYSEALRGRHVAILPDNDQRGEAHASIVARALYDIAASVAIVHIPEGKDVTEYLERGHTPEELAALIASQPILTAETLSPQQEAGPRASLLAPLCNDTGNAERLVQLYGADLRYCPPMRKWLVWDGKRWAVDDHEAAHRMAKAAMLAYFDEAAEAGNDEHRKFANRSLDAHGITSLLALAQCDSIVTPDQLDTHNLLLNFQNGEMDLASGVLSPHRREHLITKLVHYDYDPSAACPLFMSFLARAMGNHPDASPAELERAERMVQYLQRVFGYSLTGTTSEKVVFVLTGVGNNGKSTLLTTFLHLMREYGSLIQIDTLLSTHENNNTQADLADLRGARFAMTSESEEGQRLSVAKLKRITQGMGEIRAVRKYENPISFPETHKLFMDTNTLPEIRATDDAATFNRLRPIPFNVVIPPEEIDKELPHKLLAEAEGILAWAVAGAKDWRRHGLGLPPEVEEANEEWRAADDQIGHFVADCCVTGTAFTGKARVIYAEYRKWADGAGETCMTETLFGRRLARRGYLKEHKSCGAVYIGIGLRD